LERVLVASKGFERVNEMVSCLEDGEIGPDIGCTAVMRAGPLVSKEGDYLVSVSWYEEYIHSSFTSVDFDKR